MRGERIKDKIKMYYSLAITEMVRDKVHMF